MAISSARHRANEKYNAKAYDEIKIRVPKGRKAELQSYVERNGQSVNGFINQLIDSVLSPQASTVPTPSPQADTAQPQEGNRGMVLVSEAPVQNENGISRSLSLSPPDSPPSTGYSTPQGTAAAEVTALDKDRPYLPVPIWEDDSTPELEDKLIRILKKKGITVPTVAEFEAMSPEQQQSEQERLFADRERARQILDEYERKSRG